MISKVSGELTNFLKSKILTYPFGSNYGQMKSMLNKAYKGLGDDYANKIKTLADDATLQSLERKPYEVFSRKRILHPLTANTDAFKHNVRVEKLLEHADPYDKLELYALQRRLNIYKGLFDPQHYQRMNIRAQDALFNDMKAASKDYKDFVKNLKNRRLDSYKDLDTAHNDIISKLKDRVQNIEQINKDAFNNVHAGYKKQWDNDLRMRKERETTRKELIKKQLENMHDLEVKDLEHRADLRKQLAGERQYKGPMDWLAKNWQPMAAGGATAAALGAAGWNLHNAMNGDKSSEYMYE